MGLKGLWPVLQVSDVTLPLRTESRTLLYVFSVLSAAYIDADAMSVAYIDTDTLTLIVSRWMTRCVWSCPLNVNVATGRITIRP